MAVSPTELSLRVLRKRGCLCQVVEHYHAFSRRRIDLFNLFDILALPSDGSGILGVQTTDSTNFNARLTKILSAEHADTLARWHANGGVVELHGWRRPTKTRRTNELRSTLILPESRRVESVAELGERP